jgi:hypothetical protein
VKAGVKMYQRTEHRGNYDIITTVDNNGNYEQVAKWLDGTITSHCKMNVLKIGWSSVKEFLRERKGFVAI